MKIKEEPVMKRLSLPTSLRLVPFEVQFEAVRQNVWKQGATEVNYVRHSSKPLFYICYSVIWNSLLLLELQGKDN